MKNVDTIRCHSTQILIVPNQNEESNYRNTEKLWSRAKKSTGDYEGYLQLYKKKYLPWNIAEPRTYLLLVFYWLIRHADHFVHLHKLESRRQRRTEKKELLVSSLFKSEWYFLIL